MASLTNTLSVVDTANDEAANHIQNVISSKALSQSSHDIPMSKLKSSNSSNYRHTAAVHSKNNTSCLSHDSAQTPSFLGFRNLMVIVLSKPDVFIQIRSIIWGLRCFADI